LVDFVNFDF